MSIIISILKCVGLTILGSILFVLLLCAIPVIAILVVLYIMYAIGVDAIHMLFR